MYYQTWGSGKPVIALHPLALESTAFTGVAELLAKQDLRTLAADLPGFGQTPADNAPLTAARLAEPVIELARSLESPPVALGMSLGARVALEAALTEPKAFRGLALVVPYLPWVDNRWALVVTHLLSPGLAERVPLELAWPLLHRLTRNLDGSTFIEEDWLARAGVRVAYYLSCPATRRHMISASKEMMLEPATGPDSVWERMSELEIPVTFLWAGHDMLIPAGHAAHVRNRFPAAIQMSIPCSGHFVHGRHYRCFNDAMALAVRRVVEADEGKARETGFPGKFDVTEICGCSAHRHETTTPESASIVHPPEPQAARTRASVQEIDSMGTKSSATIGKASRKRHESGKPSNDEPKRAHGSSRRRLSGEDSVFVYGETESMPMHTIGTMILDPSTAPDGNFDFENLKRAIDARLHLMPPYRQRLLEVPLALDKPLLADDPDFCVDHHVHYAEIEKPGTLRDLARFVAPVAAAPLDRERPLWEMWYVDGLEDGRVALVTKMNHCMFDGASGADQMANFLDLEPQARDLSDVPPWNPEPLPSRIGLAAKGLVPTIPNPFKIASLVASTVDGYVRRAIVRSRQSSLSETFKMTGAPATRFTRSITSNRSIAFASANLDDIKAIKKVYGATVNDVVLAACALSLQRYLREDDDLPPDHILCAVPVSIKSEEEKQEMSNKVSLMSVKLPTQIEEPVELLRSINEATEAAKREFFAARDDVLADWLDLTWPMAIGIGARIFSDYNLADWLPSPANLVVSNMMGPPIPLYLAGARVDAIYPMGPVGEGTGLNITVLSNMGRVDVGLLACRETVPHLWRIAEGFEDAVRDLKLAAERAVAAA
jgi:WS/DGAT/MGAT family acyltransferase